MRAHVFNKHKILPLPAYSTISRHLRKLKPTYGFQTGVFEMLKKFTSSTDLGKHTLEDQMDKLGNHAHVVMYQLNKN